MTKVRPERTSAVVVGIEEYAAGAAWMLPGAAADALRYSRWLLSRGVPGNRLTVLLSPLDADGPAWRGLDLQPRPATREQLRSALVREIAAAEGDLLWVCWGGHGVADGLDRRRLFSCDATAEDPLNLDVDGLLALFRSSAVASFLRQIWIIDACQTYHDPVATGLSLPSEQYGAGVPLTGRRQDVLFAAGRGEKAGNLPRERTGTFSQALLAELEQADGAWPPDMRKILERTRQRLSARDGGTPQTPIYLWYRSADGAEDHWPGGRARPDDLGGEEAVVESLLAIPEWVGTDVRNQLVGRLPSAAAGAVSRSASQRLDAVAIVDTCRRFPGALDDLVEGMRLLIGDRADWRSLASAVEALKRTR